MGTFRTAIVALALTASTAAFAMDTINPRAGSGGGPGRAGFFTAGDTSTATVLGPSTVQRPARSATVRSRTGGSNSLGGRVIARPFTPTPQHALNND